MRANILKVVIGCVLASPSIFAQELIVLDQLSPSNGGFIETPSIFSIGGIGDFNGDNIGDFAFGSQPVCARIDIIYGSSTLLSTPLSVSDLDGINGRIIQPVTDLLTPQECSDGPFGNDIAAIGDFDADGFDDFSSGLDFLFAGNALVDSVSDPFGCSLPGKPELPCAEHYEIFSWRSGSSAGDFNQDGFLDLVVGDWTFGNEDEGRATVVFGPPNTANGWNNDGFFQLEDINGSNGLHLNGDANYNLGFKVSAAGDVNNDNFDDVIVTVGNLTDTTPNKAAVLLGTNIGFAALNASALNGTAAGFTILGATDDEGITNVTGNGDLNGDGISDVVVARRIAGNNFNGSVDVIFGRQDGFSANVDVTSLNGSNGFSITGGDVILLGEGMAIAGDINGDGLTDLAIGSSPGLAQEPAGLHVVFGSRSGFPAVLDVTDLNGSNGLLVQSTRADSFYLLVAKAGDVNNDGIEDLLLVETGSADSIPWVVFGNAAPQTTASIIELPGSLLGGPEPEGLSVIEIFGELYDDVDAFAGVAVRGAAADSGTWQTQIGDGAWQDLTAVSDQSAMVLEPDDLLRFLPDPGSVAGDTGMLSVRLWDGRWRDAGTAVDISTAINALGGFANDENLITLQGTIIGDVIFLDGFESLL